MTYPEKMFGVALMGHGGPEVLQWHDDLPVPTLAPTDVLIEVAAAGVNNTDINTRTAWYSKGDSDAADATWTGEPLTFPHIQGADVCGRICHVGEAVDPSRIGERILIEPSLWEANGESLKQPWYFGSECDGGFAQYTKIAARHAHRIDSALSDIELASFPCSYSTAENLLTRSRVKARERVLITGASGGVGSAAVQLAKARGAEVIALTSASKAEALRAIGADSTLDRNADLIDSLGCNSVDVVVDLVGGDQWPALLEVLRPGGRYAVSGAIGGAEVPLDLRTLYLKDLSFFGCTILEPEVFPQLIKHIESDAIKPLVAEHYPLKDIARGQAAFEEKSHVGKIVLSVV